MFKAGKIVLVVSSVEKAVKFYTERLLFDIEDLRVDKEEKLHLCYAELKRGKCFIILRLPEISELAEFSVVRGFSGRSVNIHVEAQRSLESYFKRCEKKGVPIIGGIQVSSSGRKSFKVKDPFGITLVFSDASSPQDPESSTSLLCGFDMKGQQPDIPGGDDIAEEGVRWLKGFGITRRVAKKYLKLWAKRCLK